MLISFFSLKKIDQNLWLHRVWLDSCPASLMTMLHYMHDQIYLLSMNSSIKSAVIVKPSLKKFDL